MGKIELSLRKFLAPEYIFGVGAKDKASDYCLQFGVERLCLVTDKGVVQTDWFQQIIEGLKEHKIDFVVFSDVSPNPREYEVMLGASFFKDQRCNIILAVGGGSVIDCAKGIGIVASNGGHIVDYEGVDNIPVPIPPLVCIPSTSGTAADVSQFAIINNTEAKYKMAIISKALVPDIALIDPAVLVTMDNYLTACTGMDALSHAFEAFVSNANSAFTDLYALEAIRLLDKNLIASINSPDNIEIRANVMLASLYAGLAFSNASLGCVHAMAHSLGGYLDLAHGECNALLLPHVVNYNFPEAISRYRKVGELLSIVNKGDNQKVVQRKLVEYLNDLNKSLDIKSGLKNKGVKMDVIPILSDKAINDPCNATNPRIPIKKDLEIIYSEAL